MGMTNEEAIEWIETLVETMLHETSVGPFREPDYRDEVYEALNIAIETTRKYQKIEQIVKDTQHLCEYGSAFIDIRKVVKDDRN